MNRRQRALIRARKALDSHEQYELVMALKDCVEVLEDLGATLTVRQSGSLYEDQGDDEDMITVRDRLMAKRGDTGPVLHEDQGEHGPRWWTLERVYMVSIDRRQITSAPRQPPAWDS